MVDQITATHNVCSIGGIKAGQDWYEGVLVEVEEELGLPRMVAVGDHIAPGLAQSFGQWRAWFGAIR